MHRLRKLLPALVFVLGSACTSSEGGAPKPDAPASQKKPAPTIVEAPAKTLPDGAELLAQHVEASGGAAQIAKIKSIHAQGTIEVKDHKLSGTTQLWWQADGRVYLEQEIQGIGKTRFGYDGQTIWLDDPITGLRKLDGEEAASYLQSSLMFLGHDWREHFSAANTLGKKQLEGEKSGEIWEIELVSKDGPNVTLGLDVDSKRIRTMRTTQVSLMGNMPISVTSDRYETIAGYEFPMHKVSSVSGLLELDETITKLEVNVPIDPAMFAFPSKREVVDTDPKAQPALKQPTD